MSDFNIFISYSSADRQPVEICKELEKRGLKCWIAPRDITPGMPYARAIMQGLGNSDTVLVFISANSLKSEDVLNEIDNAHGLKKNMVPVFIENVALTPEFSYYLKRKQWITAYDNPRGTIDTIAGLFGVAKKEKKIEEPMRSALAAPPFDSDFLFDRIENPVEKTDTDEFILPIEDVFTITGHGTVVTGKIESGSIHVGEQVWLAGEDGAKKTMITGIEMYRKLFDSAVCGDDVGLLLRGMDRKDVKRGMVLVSGNPDRMHKDITIATYIFTKDQGNPLKTTLKIGDKVKIYNRAKDVEATITDMSQASATNDCYLAMRLRLDSSIFIMDDDVVALKTKNQTIGVGLVYDF